MRFRLPVDFHMHTVVSQDHGTSVTPESYISRYRSRPGGSIATPCVSALLDKPTELAVHREIARVSWLHVDEEMPHVVDAMLQSVLQVAPHLPHLNTWKTHETVDRSRV